MASTNKTTNYQLSQFTGTDKPAWLGDYNQDMSKIDTAMKNNADDIAGCQGTLNTHQATIDANTQAIETLQNDGEAVEARIEALENTDTAFDGRIATAQTTAERAEGKSDTNTNSIATLESRVSADEGSINSNTSEIGTLNSALANAEAKITALTNQFNLSERSSQESSGIVNYGYTSGDTVTLAQNADGTIFKLYGRLFAYNNTGSTQTRSRVAVPGLNGIYGFKTTLKLNRLPETAYQISPIQWDKLRKNSIHTNNVIAVWQTSFAVGTDGFIYLFASEDNAESLVKDDGFSLWFTPCLYFNGDFGDTNPENPDTSSI